MDLLSIQYKMIDVEIELDNSREDNIIEHLIDFIRENDILEKPCPCNSFTNSEDVFLQYINPKLRDFLLETELFISHNNRSCKKIDARKYYDDLLDIFWKSENGDILIASFISKCIGMFLEIGQWQYGMFNGKWNAEMKIIKNPIYWNVNELKIYGSIDVGKNSMMFRPIIWFGLPDGQPTQKWTIDPCNNIELSDYIWFKESLEYSDILDDDPCDCVAFWANECGIDLPNIENLLISCPIKIRSNISYDELILSIKQFFTSKYWDAMSIPMK